MARPKDLEEAMRRGIDFIAFNDEADDFDTKTIRDYLSVIALSETFGYSTGYLAIKIKRVRMAAWVDRQDKARVGAK